HDLSQQFETVDIGQREVQQNQIDNRVAETRERLGSARGVGSDADIWDAGQRLPHAIADHGVVIADEDPDHGRGMLAVTMVPDGLPRAIVTVPPRSAARSRMLVSPIESMPVMASMGMPMPLSAIDIVNWLS